MIYAKNTANKSRSQGFTLIELMVVISIVGVLVALSVANFSNYVSRAYQGEAKIALAAIFSLEKVFYGEFNAYIEDFKAIGYLPDSVKRHYSIGWKTPTVANVVTGYSGGVGTPNYTYNNIPTDWGIDAAGVVRCDQATALLGLEDASITADANPQAYTVKARGVLRRGLPCDEWSMDQSKVITNTIISL